MTSLLSEQRVHPRPQLVRDEWTDLCGEWQFAYDDDDSGLRFGWPTSTEPFDQTIQVPYPPESKLSGIHDTTYHPVVWYRRTIAVQQPPDDDRLLLNFGAVDYRARVWLNGTQVGEHEGGHTPFCCDVTDALAPGAEQVVVVRAEDQPTDVGQPRGKQDWLPEPHDIWYHRTTGIWQPVWLERVPAEHIVEAQWTAVMHSARVELELCLSRTPETPRALRVTLRLADELLAEETVRVTERRSTFEISVAALRNARGRRRLSWSPNSPNLVDAELHLCDGFRAGDRVTSYLGLRTVGVQDGRFLLNGRSYYLRGVLAQGYWPESHLAAPDADALRREVELIKELGFNAVRVHQKVEDPRFLYWCDRLGLLVWGEMANAYSFDAEAVERLAREWLEVVRRDRSHPCVVTWVPMNESWGADGIGTVPAQRSYATALYHLTKAVDPTRPVLSNDGWEHPESDIWSIHDYASSGARLRARYGDAAQTSRMLYDERPGRRRVVLDGAVERGQPVMLTEFGGVQFDPAGDAEGWGYSSVKSAKALTARLSELFAAVLDSPTLSGFCYTQLTDTEQEQNGLLTASREAKVPVATVRRIVRGRSRAMKPEPS